MAKTLQSLGNIFLFLAGVAVGMSFSIYQLAVLVTADSPIEKLNPIFRLPDIYYVAVPVVMVALSVLLRRAARRIV
jgi:hypothetical protein